VPLPSASASPAPIESAGASPTGAQSTFPPLPTLPDGWTYRNDPAKTYRIGLPALFSFVYPKDTGLDPSFVARWGIMGTYWDTSLPDRTYCMPELSVEDLPYAKTIAINSTSDLLSWAQKDIAANGAPGQVTESSTVATVHQGFAVSLVSTAPGSAQTSGAEEHVVDIYYASQDGIWDIDVLACGDAAWNHLSSTLSQLPPYFEAPPAP